MHCVGARWAACAAQLGAEREERQRERKMKTGEKEQVGKDGATREAR